MARRYQGVLRHYSFIDKDPIIGAVAGFLKEEGLNPHQCKEISGVTVVDNWLNGDTRRPNNATVTALATACGYVRRDELDKHGKLHVGFAKARDINYRDEYEKQADWIIKHGTSKQREIAKKKLNGRRKNGG